MSQTVAVGGSNYTIPDQGDPPNWGTNLTPFFVALAAEVATAPAFFQKVAVTSTPITVGTEQSYLVASNSITATLNLPAPVQNLWFAVKDSGFNAAVNNITIHRYASEQINGVASDKVLSISGGWWMFGCDGTNWYMLRDVEALNPFKTTNQLVITPSNGAISTTVSFPVPSASRVITIGDPGADASVIMSQGAQSLAGVKTFSSIPVFSAGFTSSAASSIVSGLTISDVTGAKNLGILLDSTDSQATYFGQNGGATSNQFELAINRNVSSGTQIQTGQAAASIKMNSASGAASITFSTSSANNTSPTAAMTINNDQTVTIPLTSNQIIIGSARTVTINAPTPASTSRVWTIPDITGNGTFAALEGSQTFSGTKTFSASPVISALTASTVPYLDASKILTSSAVTPTELGYVSGVTSAIQTQIGLKAALASPTFTGTVTLPGSTTVSSTLVSLNATSLDMVGNNIQRLGRGSVSNPGLYFNNDATTGLWWPTTDEFAIANAGVKSFRTTAANSVVLGKGAALATNATDGFVYIPTCAGTPTGAPTAQTGTVAMVYDTTNNKMYVYNGAWKGGTLPGTWT